MITGEINLTKCGSEVNIKCGSDWVDVRIGDNLWLIITTEQARILRDLLIKEIKEDA